MAKVSQQQPKVESNLSSRPEALRLKASRGIVFVLVVLPALVVFGAGFAGFWIRSRPPGASVPVPHVPALPGNLKTPAPHVGPWGLLAAQPTVLQIPDECLQRAQPIATTPRWVFKGYSRHRILALFASANLSEDEQRMLSDTNHWQVQPQQIIITPPRAVILALTPPARSIIYTALAQFPENPLHHSPFYWKTKDEAELFAPPVFSEPVKALIRQLSYQKDNLSLFADLEALAPVLPTVEADRVKILKQLSSKPAVIARLHLTPETDVEAMMRYWGVAGLTKVMQPALEAVTRIPQGRTVTFLAVLPPFARERLNTYPDTTDNDGMDGFWTAFNFFNEQPEPVVTDTAHWGRKLNADYFSVFADPRYGDILVVARPTGEVLQAAVYLADDLVFTRIGPTRWEPWSIMTVADLMEISAIRLSHQEAPAISYYRNRIF